MAWLGLRRVQYLRWVGWASLAATLLVATVIVSNDRWRRQAVEDQIRAQRQLRLEVARRHVEGYMSDVGLCLELARSNQDLFAAPGNVRRYLQRVYERTKARDRVAEIAVLQGDFDRTRRPFMTFAMTGGSPDAEAPRAPVRTATRAP